MPIYAISKIKIDLILISEDKWKISLISNSVIKKILKVTTRTRRNEIFIKIYLIMINLYIYQ